MNVSARITALRAEMKRVKLDAYYVPSEDPHQSEYVPEHWERRAWISGFTGSAGEVVVTMRDAALWTDVRYYLQGARELRGSGIQLMRKGEPKTPSVAKFLGGALKKGGRLGVDPQVVTSSWCKTMDAALKPFGIELVRVRANLVDRAWSDRPPLRPDPVMAHPKQYAGETAASKIGRVRKALAERGADSLVVTELDEVAWLFNIRGSDVDFNPVAVAYALVTPKSAELFIDPRKVDAATKRALGPKVRVRPYREMQGACRDLKRQGATVWANVNRLSEWLAKSLGDSLVVRSRSPIAMMKSAKNPIEIRGMRESHIRDGQAMVRFLHWLDGAVSRGGVTELSASDRLGEFRAEGKKFRGLSFPAISGYAANGAVIHYRVDESTSQPLSARGLYLIDSGGQYADGTTDITRTVLLGKKAKRSEREPFTRVLKGMIALTVARFPAGTFGFQLDLLARQPLWEARMNFGHGTGHGVGSYLNVHEGPQSIGPRAGIEPEPLVPGNILSNEPGYYEDGVHGMRIENLILVEEEKHAPGWLRFETITACPIDTRLVEPRLLGREERDWLNTYHRWVKRVLTPGLEPGPRKWLATACRPI
jgi:Xaa-Pro aminopeptidase